MNGICRWISLFTLTTIIALSSKAQQHVDLIVFNAHVYTVDKSFGKAEAFAISKGKIIAVGNTKDILLNYKGKEQLNANGKYVYPGFIDAHAHFVSYGLSLQTIDLTGSKTWEEVLERAKSFASSHSDGWLTGRGWDQNTWPVKEFPDNEKLNELFPDRPVVLTRIDGHAVIANRKALELAGISEGDKIEGGEIQIVNGKLTGILVDNAIELVNSKKPSPTPAEGKAALLNAQQNCFAVGLTTIADCGLDYDVVEFIDNLQKEGSLKMRLYIMLSDKKKNYDYLVNRGKIKTDRLNVCSFKLYADGALGSRGACMLKPYSDRPGWYGFLLNNQKHYDSAAKFIYDHGFQMCTHAIGDSGNRTILKIYAKYLKGKNDRRWRIEHAQVINKDDFHYFGDYSIVPSVQPTHATSDMSWAGERIGKERMIGAYAYNDLLKENAWIPLGTDFPIEDISPGKTFYAAVVRKDKNGLPKKGFQPQNALSRKDALRGITIWAAKAGFEEKEKGSIEKGKLADFVILDTDLMKADEKELLQTKVLMTYVNGEKVFGK